MPIIISITIIIISFAVAITDVVAFRTIPYLVVIILLYDINNEIDYIECCSGYDF